MLQSIILVIAFFLILGVIVGEMPWAKPAARRKQRKMLQAQGCECYDPISHEWIEWRYKRCPIHGGKQS